MVSSKETSFMLSGLTVGQVGICEVVVLFALSRWFFCWVFKLLINRSNYGITQTNQDTHAAATPSSSPSSSRLSSHILIERDLVLTTFGAIKERLPESTCDTCAVCLNQLMLEDEVRELRNCRHVFHKECIDRWLDHDQDHHISTCPLCRAPLLKDPLPLEGSACCLPAPQPSWAAERLIYLFGDDLPRC